MRIWICLRMPGVSLTKYALQVFNGRAKIPVTLGKWKQKNLIKKCYKGQF